MRKFAILFISLISVLSLWGRQASASFSIDNARTQIEELEAQNTQVAQKAQNLSPDKITAEEKAQVLSTLQSTFSEIHTTLDNYLNLTPQQQAHAQNLISGFINKYHNNIYAKDRNGNLIVDVSTGSFLKTCYKFKHEFAKLNQSVHSVPTETAEAANPETTATGAHATPTGTEGGEDNADNEDDASDIPFERSWSIAALIVGFLGFAFGIIAIFLALALQKKVDRKEDDTRYKLNNFNRQITELKNLTSQANAAIQSLNAGQSKFRQQSQTRIQSQTHQQNIRQTGKTYPHPQQVPTPQPIQPTKSQQINPEPEPAKPSFVHLYATVNASSPVPEFFKVSNDNSAGDKVFMITLRSANDESGEFYIAPDLSDDFIKSVIVDRETYLPTLFCEKEIMADMPNRIKMVSAGKAKKVGGKWQVQERMVVQLL